MVSHAYAINQVSYQEFITKFLWVGTNQAGRNSESIGKGLHSQRKPNTENDVMVEGVEYALITQVVNSSRLREKSKRRDGLVHNLIKFIQNLFQFRLPDFSFYCWDRAALSIHL